ncbi:MAG: TetR/AcrR family transcriptional regulator [Bacteroidetes bacterium]|nr:TetR/AcrR family transcriptional regulator [Bacteroidota bacterium]
MSTEEKILKGAEELFFKYGVRSVTMDDIARHLGMSKKTIYQYYKEKDEVVHKLMQAHIREDERMCINGYERANNVVEEVFNVMQNITEIFSKVNPLLFYELQKYYPQSWKLIKHFKEDFILGMVEKSIEKGKRDGYVRPDVNTRILSRLRMEEIELTFNAAVYPADKFSIVEVQLTLAEHFLYGICTFKGHKLINKYKQVVEEE